MIAIFDKTTGVVRCTAPMQELPHLLGTNEVSVEVDAPVVDARYDAETGAFLPHRRVPEPTYADLRRREYPPASDYLDAMVKGDREAIEAYVSTCQAVKAKYPKP